MIFAKKPVAIGIGVLILGVLFLSPAKAVLGRYKYFLGGYLIEDAYTHGMVIDWFNGIGDKRTIIEIPGGFGKMVAVTQDATFPAVWFENENGDIQNITIDATNPYYVKRWGDMSHK